MAAGFKNFSALLRVRSAFPVSPVQVTHRQTSRGLSQINTKSQSRTLAGGSAVAAFLTLSGIYYFSRKKKAGGIAGNAPPPSPSQPSHPAVSVDTTPKNRIFANKCVLITGGAGDIGSSVALAFSREGAKVVLVDLPRTEPALKEKCDALVKAGAESASYVTADVTNVEDVKDMVEQTKKVGGSIDIFFNNAGILGILRPLPEQDDEGFRKVLDVNIYGVFLGMKYVSKAMQESGRGGVIVNTASVAGLIGPANMSAYAASKFAVVGMTKSAAKDLARYGIRVCAIAPGILEGKLWDTQVYGIAECRKFIDNDSSPIMELDIKNQERRMIDANPIKRLGKLSEVASVVKFLCSEDASYLTGVIIPIDGGRLR